MSDFKRNYDFILGIIFIAILTGMAIESVGDTSGDVTYSWWLPIGMLIITGIPFMFGFQAGRKAEKP